MALSERALRFTSNASTGFLTIETMIGATMLCDKTGVNDYVGIIGALLAAAGASSLVDKALGTSMEEMNEANKKYFPSAMAGTFVGVAAGLAAFLYAAGFVPPGTFYEEPAKAPAVSRFVQTQAPSVIKSVP
jgi:hypothetical protein